MSYNTTSSQINLALKHGMLYVTVRASMSAFVFCVLMCLYVSICVAVCLCLSLVCAHDVWRTPMHVCLCACVGVSVCQCASMYVHARLTMLWKNRHRTDMLRSTREYCRLDNRCSWRQKLMSEWVRACVHVCVREW